MWQVRVAPFELLLPLCELLLLLLLVPLVLSGRQLIKSSAAAGDRDGDGAEDADADGDGVGAGAAGIIVAIKSFPCEQVRQKREGRVERRGKKVERRESEVECEKEMA